MRQWLRDAVASALCGSKMARLFRRMICTFPMLARVSSQQQTDPWETDATVYLLVEAESLKQDERMAGVDRAHSFLAATLQYEVVGKLLGDVTNKSIQRPRYSVIEPRCQLVKRQSQGRLRNSPVSSAVLS